MNILDFLTNNPVQMQQLAATVDPAPILAQLDKVGGGAGTYGMADILNPQPMPQPMPIDPMAAMANAPVYQGSAMPQPAPGTNPSMMPLSAVPLSAPEEPTMQDRAAKGLEAANRAAELDKALNPQRPQAMSPGSPAAGKTTGAMKPIFQGTPGQAPMSLAQLLGMIK